MLGDDPQIRLFTWNRHNVADAGASGQNRTATKEAIRRGPRNNP
jgi:hypothetical protein